MRRSLLTLVIAAGACGGKAKSTTPPPPLPDDKPPVADKPPAEPQEKEPPPPLTKQGPAEVTLPAPKVEVKLVNAGKGKKAKLALSPKAGAKQTTELVLDFTGGQDGPPETGGKRDEIAPTVVLTADAETQAVDDKGQSKFLFTFSGIDVRDKAGQKVPSAEFKNEMTSLIGATLAGTVDANGQAGDIKVRVEKADWICRKEPVGDGRPPVEQCGSKAEGALEFVRLGLLPLFPILPTEPVGPGAKWTVTSTQKLADQVEVTKVVSYELVGKKGTAWTIKGTTKVSGVDQEVEAVPNMPKAKLSNIGGNGSSEVVVNDGVLVPTVKQTLATGFSITLTAGPVQSGQPPPKTIEIKFRIEQQNALTPKG